MKLTGMIFNGHKWVGSGALKGLMVVVGLISMVLGGSADTQWF